MSVASFKPKELSFIDNRRAQVNCTIDNALNSFSTNVPIMDKPGSWFLLPKCLKNTCGRVTF